jgi:hypothetical protein
MFFSDSRQHFFNPLTGKYRELVSECLNLLYQRLYTDLRDYGNALSREQLVDIFKEAIARSPILDADKDDESEDDFEKNDLLEQEGRFKTQQGLANFVINRLVEHGWLEKHFDEANLQSTYGFTRIGRLFTQPFVDNQAGQFRTRNRNTRNTRNSLSAFYERGEIHDLLDAYGYSERIISDFTDVISELEERKRQLVREVESRELIQQASDEFFSFMERNFRPDLEVRFSADSVEKYREEISEIIKDIRRKRKYAKGDAETAGKDWRAVMEIRLRKALPDKVVPGTSLLETLLQGIELRLRNACDVMLPALRRALNTFTQRADIIIRQLSYIHTQGTDDVVALCRELSQLTEPQQNIVLLANSEPFNAMQLAFVDPAQIQLRAPWQKNIVNSVVQQTQSLDSEAHKAIFIQQALDQAFIVQGSALRDYVYSALTKTGRVNSKHLTATTMPELLNLAHAIEVGALENLSSRYSFRVEQDPLLLAQPPAIVQDHYFTRRDEFAIILLGTKNE